MDQAEQEQIRVEARRMAFWVTVGIIGIGLITMAFALGVLWAVTR